MTGSETLVIIDVRDEDEVWHDGQIKGPVLHIPSTRFSSLANAKDIIRDHDLLAKGIIAVHCHKSQQRGPYCARLLAAAASELEEESAAKIHVLRYGYEGFHRRFAGSTEGESLIHFPSK